VFDADAPTNADGENTGEAMSVIDAFMIFDELDMADLRFHVLDPVVDMFVVVESGVTHSGLPKPRYFGDALDAGRFAEFAHKIAYSYTPTLEGDNSWMREHYQRGLISGVLQYFAQSEDWVIVGDADEIANPLMVYMMAKQQAAEAAQLELEMFYYDFQHRVQQGWAIGACRWRVQNDANKIRTCDFGIAPMKLLYGGWHFSYFGDALAIMRKSRAFMHHDWIDAYGLTIDKVQAALDAGTDLWGRDLKIDRVPVSDSLPRYVLEHRAKYEALGWLERQTESEATL
jgi:beta-1,4-mannosyl-glycoprotein beta-1,4-N-acetylglucosaminyltransferase